MSRSRSTDHDSRARGLAYHLTMTLAQHRRQGGIRNAPRDEAMPATRFKLVVNAHDAAHARKRRANLFGPMAAQNHKTLRHLDLGENRHAPRRLRTQRTFIEVALQAFCDGCSGDDDRGPLRTRVPGSGSASAKAHGEPVTASVCPVTQLDASSAKNNTALAMSSGLPMRRMATRASTACCSLSL